MRRREKPDENDVPVRLIRFRPHDWPDGCHPECVYWVERARWQEANPDVELPLDAGPDTPFHCELI